MKNSLAEKPSTAKSEKKTIKMFRCLNFNCSFLSAINSRSFDRRNNHIYTSINHLIDLVNECALTEHTSINVGIIPIHPRLNAGIVVRSHEVNPSLKIQGLAEYNERRDYRTTIINFII